MKVVAENGKSCDGGEGGGGSGTAGGALSSFFFLLERGRERERLLAGDGFFLAFFDELGGSLVAAFVGEADDGEELAFRSAARPLRDRGVLAGDLPRVELERAIIPVSR